MRKILVAIIIIVFLMSSCSKSDGTSGSGNTTGGGDTTSCATTPKAFDANVNPIIQNFCNIASCHNSGSFNGPGPLTNYTQIFDARTSIRSAVSTGLMPQNTTLTTAQKNSILCWIDAGAQNN
ncbi:MAG: hypothetical protein JJE22_03660 [Bacteroidia bacterium]|nr:hypothetical protein [Bacteroidia bacterium]